MPSAGFELAIPATKAPQTCDLYRAATVIGEADALGQDKRNFGTTVNRVGSVVVGFHAQIYHCHKHAWFGFLKRVTCSGIINKNNFDPQSRTARTRQSVQRLGCGLTTAAWVKGPLTSIMALGPTHFRFHSDVWFLINPAQMLGQYLNIILASGKRFRSGRFHEFLFTSPQLSHQYKTTAENY